MVVAIKPGVDNKIVKVAAWYPQKKEHAIESKRSYDWGAEYMKFFWIRLFIVTALLAAPGLLVLLSLWPLLGYVWLGVPVINALVYKKYTSNRPVATAAYGIVSQLKQGWAEHGQVFYSQIWSHDCKGNKVDYSYSYRPDRNKVYNCSYCDKRVKELNMLLDSQKEVEHKTAEPINEQMFEASEQFRLAVQKQLEPDPIMAEISAAATAGPVKRGSLKNTLRHRG